MILNPKMTLEQPEVHLKSRESNLRQNLGIHIRRLNQVVIPEAPLFEITAVS